MATGEGVAVGDEIGDGTGVGAGEGDGDGPPNPGAADGGRRLPAASLGLMPNRSQCKRVTEASGLKIMSAK